VLLGTSTGPGWSDIDRLLVLALDAHDAEVCHCSAPVPVHYVDERDEDLDGWVRPAIGSCWYLEAWEQYQKDVQREGSRPDPGTTAVPSTRSTWVTIRSHLAGTDCSATSGGGES
jgi:hypothetical protein